MEKAVSISISSLFLLLLFLASCQQTIQGEAPVSEKEGDFEGITAEAIQEFQVTACNAADKAGTCDSRLNELGIVSKEECCESLGRCC